MNDFLKSQSILDVFDTNVTKTFLTKNYATTFTNLGNQNNL